MNALKIALWIIGIGCLTAVLFLFLPWAVVESMVSWSGVELLPDTPILIYFYKVIFGVFGLIGVFFLILSRNPFK
jgi:hypothetical protein